MQADIFWKEAAILAKRVAGRLRLNPQYVGGDTRQVKMDLEQDALMGAGTWLGQHEDLVEHADDDLCRSHIYRVVKSAIFESLRQVNRENGHEFSSSDWLENMGEDELASAPIEQQEEETEMQEDTLDEIIENHENNALKKSIKCLDKEMQAIVILHNDGFSFTEIASKMNFSRERPRQLYHKAMRQLKERVAGGDVAHDGLPLNYPPDETLLYSTQAEKIRELKFRVKSTRGNISNSTRATRQAEKGGQLALF